MPSQPGALAGDMDSTPKWCFTQYPSTGKLPKRYRERVHARRARKNTRAVASGCCMIRRSLCILYILQRLRFLLIFAWRGGGGAWMRPVQPTEKPYPQESLHVFNNTNRQTQKISPQPSRQQRRKITGIDQEKYWFQHAASERRILQGQTGHDNSVP